jgi:hypothetical protein
MASPGLFLFALLVWDCFGSGCAIDWRDRDMRDLLPGCGSLRWDSNIASIIRMLARVRAGVSSPVRSGLRRLGEFHPTGISAYLVRSAACAASVVYSKSARATVASSRIKRETKSEIGSQKRVDRANRLA